MREDFSAKVVRKLAERAGHLCSNPSCKRPTAGPVLSNPNQSTITGIAAHICAAAPGGPRYDISQTSAERSDISNAIWLCATCATLIDKNNGIDYPANLLHRWKDVHEEKIKARQEGCISGNYEPCLPNDFIEYEVNQGSVERYTHSEVLKKAAAFLLFSLSLIVNLLIAISITTVNEPLYLWLFMPIILFLLFKMARTSLFFWMYILPKSDKNDQYILGKYIHKDLDENYTTYRMEAQCNQPKCTGIVNIFPAPAREKHLHSVIGRCNLMPNFHTFTVEHNHVGRYQEMDFRPVNEKP